MKFTLIYPDQFNDLKEILNVLNSWFDDVSTTCADVEFSEVHASMQNAKEHPRKEENYDW